jgi:hypothetical protein
MAQSLALQLFPSANPSRRIRSSFRRCEKYAAPLRTNRLCAEMFTWDKLRPVS